MLSIVEVPLKSNFISNAEAGFDSYMCECEVRPYHNVASDREWESLEDYMKSLGFSTTTHSIVNKDCPNTDFGRHEIIAMTEHMYLIRDVA